MNLRLIVLAGAALALPPSWAQESGVDAARQKMIESAAALAASVDGAGPLDRMLGIVKADELLYPLDDEQRQNWQFWPTQRVGLTIEAMSGEQKRLTHDLLRATLSAGGYLKVVHIMQLEQILEMLDEAGFPRAVDHYKVALFGTPSGDAPWAWRFEGHHVSLSVAVSPDGIRVTPSFLGSNPAEVRSGPMTGFRVHGVLEDLARELVTSLRGEQRAEAVRADTAPREIFTATINKPREEWETWRETLLPEGVQVGALNEMQRQWVGMILDEVIGNYRPALAAHYRDALDVDSLRFAWMGSVEAGEPHYFRLQGDSFVFEYDNVQNMGNHVHAVWRDKDSDFGTDVLAEHYRTSHSR